MVSRAGERLQKVLARRGVASRRAAEQLISQGRVRVNGQAVQLGTKVSESDRIEVDGEVVSAVEHAVTLMLNKPRGVLSTVRDERGRKTVMDLLPDIPGLHPIGRLDLESEGLLLLSTDGELTLRLSHPRYGHSKTYRVWCEQGTLPAPAISRLRSGLELEDGPAKAVAADPAQGGCQIVLAEGRKRQVRRMLEALGFDVVRLVRTKIGRLGLGGLPSGQWRELTVEEIESALAER